VPATPRPLDLHIKAKTKPGQRRQDFEGWLASTVRSNFTTLVQPEPGETGRFFTSLSDVQAELPAGASLRCVPEAPDLTCTIGKIAIAQPGVIPLLKEIAVER
jgi:hypothetical protein